jgi:PPOX class probable F420-dependent enzyme
MATINRDGSPQLTPNWYYYDGERLTFITTKERLKFFNLRRDSRMSVCIYDAPLASDYVVIQGQASIADAGFWDDARLIVSRYVEPERVDEYIARWQAEPRILVTVTPDKIYTRNR